MAFFLATMMFSLAGIPPLAGFFAKFYVFAAAIKAGLYRARGDRRARERGRPPITICASSSSCISTSPRRRSTGRASRRASCWRCRRCWSSCSSSRLSLVTDAAMAAAQVAVLNAASERRPLSSETGALDRFAAHRLDQ